MLWMRRRVQEARKHVLEPVAGLFPEFHRDARIGSLELCRKQTISRAVVRSRKYDNARDELIGSATTLT